MGEKKKGFRCVLCRLEIPTAEIQRYPVGISGCPNCGTKLLPMRIEHDMEVSLNWQDIRVLAIYAKRWTTVFDIKQISEKQSIQALDELIARLAKYQPEGALPITPPDKPQKKNEGEEKREDGSILSPFY